MAYYKQIYGVKYDSNLLKIADDIANANHFIPNQDFHKIKTAVFDAGVITNIEIDTLKYIYQNYDMNNETKILFLELIVFPNKT